jgi:hypothetical protein
VKNIIQAAHLADQLYAARDAARIMCGDSFSGVMSRFGGHISRLAPHCGGVLQAAEKWARAAADADDGKAAVIILAAAVELLEPSQEATDA